VNLAGAEFGQATLPGVHGQHYLYPNQAEVDYFRRKGMNCVRLCFRWERLQRSVGAALDPVEFGRFDAFVERTTAKGVHVILDPHNFARYLDRDSSGSSPEIVRATIGRERLAGFTQWLRTHQRRGFLGEFAVANSTIDEGLGAEALDHMLGHLADNADVWLGWTWWAAGPWWHEYMFTLEPPDLGSASPTDRPAMAGLVSHIPVPVPVPKLVAPDRIEFEARAGFVFQPEVSQTLTPAGWTDQGPAIVGDGQPVHAIAPAVSGSDQFFRVRVLRPP